MTFMELSEVLGNWGEFVGAIAVVMTLIYLAVQVRQNSAQLKTSVDAMQVSGYQQLMDRITEVNRLTIEDPDFTRIQLLADTNPGEMNEIDTRRYYAYLITLTRHADMAFMLYQKGMLDEEQYRSALGPFVGTMRNNHFLRKHVERVANSEFSVFTEALKEELRAIHAEVEKNYPISTSMKFRDFFTEDLATFQRRDN